MTNKISLTDTTLPSCFCGSFDKLKATLTFGYLSLQCNNCGRKMMSENRSGSIEYLVDIEMRERWENENTST